MRIPFVAFVALCAAAVASALSLAVSAPAQEQLPEQSALLTVCQSARGLAQLGGLSLTNCRKVAVVEEGNTALVTVKVKVDGAWYIYSASLMKTAWSQQAFQVMPA